MYVFIRHNKKYIHNNKINRKKNNTKIHIYQLDIKNNYTKKNMARTAPERLRKHPYFQGDPYK